MIRPVSHVGAMAPYELASLDAPMGQRLVSLSQNECLRGPSPAAIEAAAQVARQAHQYPDADWMDLRAAIAQVHDIDPSLILCGNGSLDLIGALARAYLGPKDAALAPAHAYPFFRSATDMTGARFDTAPENAFLADIETLVATITPETKIIFLANPGNPTGTRVPRAEVLKLRDALPENVILVIDEAYGEFADHLNEPMFDLVGRGNTIVLRTFSKAYGLAGMRVGWGLFPPAIATEIRKLLNPNNVAVSGQMAARAAMLDQAYMRETCAQTASVRDGFAARMRATGLTVPESFTNFTLLHFPSAAAAADADAFLRAQGVFLRPQGGAGLPDCLRATAGVADDMELAASLLEDWMQGKARP